MARHCDAFQLVVAVTLIVVATLVQGASAARKVSEQPSRRLSQIGQSLWYNGEIPKQAVLYDQQYFNGKSLRLKLGANALSRHWTRAAKSLWLPDGYTATLHIGGGNTCYAFRHAGALTKDYLEAPPSKVVPTTLDGKITHITIAKDLTWAARIHKDINSRRTKEGLGALSLNNKASEFARSRCQSDAHNLNFGELSTNLPQELTDAGAFAYGVGVVRERGIFRKAADAVQKMYSSKQSKRLLSDQGWLEMGVGYSQYGPGDTEFYVCVVLIYH